MSGDEPIDWIIRSNARAKGQRQDYFEDPAIDRLLSIVMALAGEMSVIRERQDTVERLLEAKGLLSRAEIESYEPDAQAGHERGVMTRAYVARILRGVQQDMEAIVDDDPPVEQVSRELLES
jgi:hypothetical protein